MSAATKVVVVTGASAGIGRATARMFAERGYAVGLLARGSRELAAAADDVRALGGVPLALRVDVADHAAVAAAAVRVEEELGPIEVWVNSAFTAVFAPLRRWRRAPFPAGPAEATRGGGL